MSAPRPDLYRPPHKGIRALLADLVTRAGRTSFADPAEVAALRDATEAAFFLLRDHAHHEETHVHPLLQRHAPEIEARLQGAHDEQHADMDAITEALARHAADFADPADGHDVVIAICRYAGAQLGHMADEEALALPALLAACDDATLAAAHAAIVGSIPPETMAQHLRWMLPAMTVDERAGMLRGIEAGAPPEAFAGILRLAREVLSEEQWTKLPWAAARAA